MPMSAFVASAPRPTAADVRAREVARFTPVGWPAHSGHLIPTAAKTMQSVQIGRPQLEQATAVSVLGCR
jgi:hypothetical protein